MSKSETQRIPNFTPGEKEVLMEIVLNHADVLEDKKTNRSTTEKKQEVWTQIEKEFNNKAPTVTYRREGQLKRLYENKKKELRKKMALYKNQQYKTGGGPPPKEPKLDAVEEILIKIVNEKTVNGFLHGTAFDSDDGGPVARIPYEDHEKNDNTMKPTNVQEYEYGSEDFSTFAQDYDMNDIPALEEVQSQRCPPSVLQGPVHHKLKVQPVASTSNVLPQAEISSPATTAPKKVQSKTSNMLSFNRRRPMGGIRALTSSDVAEKYNLLLDKRLVLVQKQIEESAGIHNFNIEEQKLKMKILKQQEENLSLEKEERILKIELLKADLKYKK